uniref:Uncharacterized protein n=1 Tax=Odontella aurita TaxID=265563 RepID=A0A7S4I711_9STRA|mmetsp:Transcript_20757/g.60385  ORF Transcript_20757/g.60385 Transcript_20757/m.60385 type:complete len:284 (+) Transcript_20757:437-1288(+)|eukprot:CAMPEP_0113545734 /NCGR_PEP_ID=MMETSP0015_2-20120614/11425_1 /TAXON_ID=2838 /ORGANISM="Odontella" /LENGTH=283 /DNA_ID=CAMNT_0000446131 /DNA_START=148 /DNA_END=999 /DNA_ORIENTATION=+ /assembly_acc=CAM_ASM_000160
MKKMKASAALVAPMLISACLRVDAFATPRLLSGAVERRSATRPQPRHEQPNLYAPCTHTSCIYPKRTLEPSSRRSSSLPSKSTTTALAAFAAVASAVDVFYRTSPLLAAFLTCGANASAADVVAQKRASSAARAGSGGAVAAAIPFEKRRTLAFLLYGGLYQGVAQEFLYNRFLPKLFGSGSSPSAVIGKVLFDMLILTPILCLPVAYVVKSMVYQRPLSDAWNRYSYDVREAGLLKKCWCLWGPVQCLTFGIVPEHFRVSFVSSVSFFWLIVLSTISSGKSD